MKARAHVAGHPVHATLTDLPVGLWIGSFLADVTYALARDPFWYDFAWWLMAAGLAAALVTAAFGAIDYFGAVPPGTEARRVARTHGLLNLGIAALYAFNLWWRFDRAADRGSDWWLAVALAVLAIGALVYSGWLGGELVYRHGIGVLPEAGPEAGAEPRARPGEAPHRL